MEYTNLQHARFLDYHRDRIALRTANFAMLTGRFRHLLRPQSSRDAQPMNQLSYQLWEVACALLLADRYGGQLHVAFNS